MTSPTPDSIYSAALACGARRLELEALLVSSGRHDPKRLLAACETYSISSFSPTDGNCRALLEALFCCAKQGYEPEREPVKEYAESIGAQFNSDADFDHAYWWADCSGANIERYAELLSTLLDRQHQAQEHLSAARRLLLDCLPESRAVPGTLDVSIPSASSTLKLGTAY